MEIEYAQSYKQSLIKIRQAQNILLVTHEKPDCDAISSVGTMIELLEKMKKKYFAYCNDSAPHQYEFLPHAEKINSNKTILNFPQYDLIMIFDCGGLNRTKLGEEIAHRQASQYVIEFDHHIKIDDFADLEIRDSSAAATSEMMYDFFKINNLKINKNIAQCILAGTIMDSGNFFFPSTSPKTVQISSEMLALGASLPKIMINTYRNKSIQSMKIWGKAMSGLQINKKYNLAFTILTKEDVAKINEEELEGVSNFIGNLHNVNGVMFLREQEDGLIKGSLRSAHPTADMAKLAQVLGGGGHKKAAGFKIEGRLEKKGERWKII